MVKAIVATYNPNVTIFETSGQSFLPTEAYGHINVLQKYGEQGIFKLLHIKKPGKRNGKKKKKKKKAVNRTIDQVVYAIKRGKNKYNGSEV